MDHSGDDAGTATWEFDASQVQRIWLDTRQVFGNKLWIDGMCGVFRDEWRREAEERSGRSFFDLLCSAARDLSPGDPSEIFLAFQREFAKYGISTVFARHFDHGDVLERARRLDAGEPLPKPGPYRLDEDLVTEVWDLIADGLADGFIDGCAVVECFPDDLLDELERASREQAFLLVDEVLDKLAEDADPSQAFLGLRELAAEHGVELTFAPHPRFDDLIERATRLRADEPA
ncbi:hypothetical protein F7Q99_29150 [Streptomyces kaniharaensis]|uniref:Uncharacterized protein n=1 Tax=Streptomyces kaniharaensis TaxID=212423 RepID=A0A6N7L0I8_9ACTN|nr:hypothetical protein [Streptomyces kaniharaensis]MQS16187.1 hypothetical protein [Streptomyces kaniharaensis]